MDFIDSLFSRKSIRSYTGECVSEKDLNTILLAGNAAPVGKGRYDALHITVISDPSLLEEIAKLTAEYLGKPDMHPLYGAPHLIVVSIKEDSIVIESQLDHTKQKLARWAIQQNLTVHEDDAVKTK